MRKWIGFVALLAGLAVLTVPAMPLADAQDKKEMKKDGKKDAKKGEAKKDAKAKDGSVEIYKDNAGNFRFRIKDGDGKVIAMPAKGYAEKEDVDKVLEQIKAILDKAKPVEGRIDVSAARGFAQSRKRLTIISNSPHTRPAPAPRTRSRRSSRSAPCSRRPTG